MKNFENKIVFIIGGSRGIGLSTAKLLASKGAHVAIFARDQEDLAIACEEIKKECLSENQVISFKRLDAVDDNMVNNVLKEAVKDFGIPDLFINCAGRAIPMDFEEVTASQFDETMKLNLYTIRNTIFSILPYMKKNGGYIVNVSSMAGFIGVYGYSDYCASKYAIIGFSEALKWELKQHGIKVSVLCPPDTDTPGFENENLTKSDIVKAISKAGNLLSPDRVASELLKGIKKSKFIIVPGLDGKFIYFMKRHFQFIINFFISNTIKSVLKKSNQNINQIKNIDEVDSGSISLLRK